MDEEKYVVLFFLLYTMKKVKVTIKTPKSVTKVTKGTVEKFPKKPLTNLKFKWLKTK